MRRKPRKRQESLFSGGLQQRIVLRGLAVGGLTYFVFQTALNRGASLDYAQTLAFATLIFAQLWHIFDARSATTIFGKNPLSNPLLLGAVAFSAILSLLAIMTPPGHFVLGTAALSLPHILQVIFIAALPTVVLSGIKEVFGFRFL